MFFEKLAELIGENYTVQIIAKVKSEKLTLTFIPQLDSKEKDIVAKLVPLTITEAPSEIDRQIIPIITQAMSKTSSLAEALAAYEKGVDAAKKALDKKDDKTTAKETPKVGKAEVKAEEPKVSQPPKEDWEQEEKQEKESASEEEDSSPEDVDVNTGEIKEKETTEEKVVKKDPEMKTSVSMKDLEEMEESEEETETSEEKVEETKEKDTEDDW